MALIDRCHFKHQLYGIRRVRDWHCDEGHQVNRKRPQRLVRTMGIMAQYTKRNLSAANRPQKSYPALLRNLDIDRPNLVWATDITYLPMDGGCIVIPP